MDIERCRDSKIRITHDNGGFKLPTKPIVEKDKQQHFAGNFFGVLISTAVIAVILEIISRKLKYIRLRAITIASVLLSMASWIFISIFKELIDMGLFDAFLDISLHTGFSIPDLIFDLAGASFAGAIVFIGIWIYVTYIYKPDGW